MSDLLFVYGSLLQASGHANAARLGREAAAIVPAFVQGRLWRVDWYPGLTPSDDPQDCVHGELVTLADASVSLPWLDAYEGLDRSDEYVRVRRPVVTADGATLEAWVYLYQRPTAGLEQVVNGRWLG